MATYEWQSIAEEFLGYLGALSVETPDLGTPEANDLVRDRRGVVRARHRA
jgi:hypothetical protein